SRRSAWAPHLSLLGLSCPSAGSFGRLSMERGSARVPGIWVQGCLAFRGHRGTPQTEPAHTELFRKTDAFVCRPSSSMPLVLENEFKNLNRGKTFSLLDLPRNPN